MKPDGFFVFGSMNWSGGKERSTPRSAFLLLVHLSRMDVPASARDAAKAGVAALPTSAVAPAPTRAAFSRSPRVEPFCTWSVPLSDIVRLPLSENISGIADVRIARDVLQCARFALRSDPRRVR